MLKNLHNRYIIKEIICLKSKEKGERDMGFFDEIGNKITGLGQESVKKTQNFTEVMKMNGEINEMEKGINAFYTEIGKIYYQKYAAESEDQEIIDYARKIEDNLKRIAILQAQIRNIKGLLNVKAAEQIWMQKQSTATSVEQNRFRILHLKIRKEDVLHVEM